MCVYLPFRQNHLPIIEFRVWLGAILVVPWVVIKHIYSTYYSTYCNILPHALQHMPQLYHTMRVYLPLRQNHMPRVDFRVWLGWFLVVLWVVMAHICRTYYSTYCKILQRTSQHIPQLYYIIQHIIFYITTYTATV